jgi:hypothetical protein
MRNTRLPPFEPSHVYRPALHADQEISRRSGDTSDLFEGSYVYVGVNEDEIRARLRAFGQEPIDEQTRAAHMRRIAAGGVVSEPRRRGMVWAGIAAAAVVGFLAGSTGLAMADALPDTAQDVAHVVLGAVQVDVPAGKEDKRGPCVAEAAKLKDKDAKKAAMDACPKGGGAPDDSYDPNGADVTPGKSGEAPGHSGDAPGKSGEAPGQTKHEGEPCHGRPPWAGTMSKEERDAAKQEASRETCPPDADEDSASNEDTEADDSDEANDQSEANKTAATTTTIAEQPTTTTVGEDTTTTTTSPEPSGD